MKFKSVVTTALILLFAGVPAFAKTEAKSSVAKPTQRKVACDGNTTNHEALAGMIIGQIVRGKLLVENDEYVYRNLREILKGSSKYRVEGVECSGVLNGGNACVLRVMIKIDEGEEVFNDLDVRVSRDGKVTRAELLHVGPPPSEGVG